MNDHYRYAAWIDLLTYAKKLKAKGNEAKAKRAIKLARQFASIHGLKRGRG